MKWIVGAAFAVGMLTSASAHAAVWNFSFTGQIGTQSAVDSKFNPIPVPSMPINTGDTVSGSITFLDNRSSIDHSGNGASFYFTSGRNFLLNVGTTSTYSSPPGQEVFNRVVVSNDVTAYGGRSDGFNLSSLIFAPVPFGTGVGSSAVIFSYYVYDPTGLALNSERIEEIQPLTAFPFPGSMSIGFNDNGFNGSGRIVSMDVKNLSASLVRVDVVPEPATWALMLTGMMMTGYSLRRRNAPLKLA